MARDAGMTHASSTTTQLNVFGSSYPGAPSRLSADPAQKLATGFSKGFAVARKCKLNHPIAKLAFERGHPVDRIAKLFGVTKGGVIQASRRYRWQKPEKFDWRKSARRLYELGVKCEWIGLAVDKAGVTVADAAAKQGWERLSAFCWECGANVHVRKQGNRKMGQKRECHRCCLQRKYKKRTPERRIEERRREAAKKGKHYRTLDEHKKWLCEKYPKSNRYKADSPHSEVGRYRYYGTMPTSRGGLLLAIRDTLTQLLRERCKLEGITIDTARYRMRYKNDPAFRAKEKAKAAGQHSKRESMMRRDGTLTPDVVRRLFVSTSVCPYCDCLMTPNTKTLDHMTPVSLGGVHGISNVTVCCYSCNSRKRNMAFDRWLTKLPPHIAARFQQGVAA